MWLLPNGEVEQAGDLYKEVSKLRRFAELAKRVVGWQRTAMPQLARGKCQRANWPRGGDGTPSAGSTLCLLWDRKYV